MEGLFYLYLPYVAKIKRQEAEAHGKPSVEGGGLVAEGSYWVDWWGICTKRKYCFDLLKTLFLGVCVCVCVLWHCVCVPVFFF